MSISFGIGMFTASNVMCFILVMFFREEAVLFNPKEWGEAAEVKV